MFAINRGNEEIFESDEILTDSTRINVINAQVIDNEDIYTSRVIPSQAYSYFTGDKNATAHHDDSIFCYEENLELPWQKLARIKTDLVDFKQQLNVDTELQISQDSSNQQSLLSIISSEVIKMLKECDSIDPTMYTDLVKRLRSNFNLTELITALGCIVAQDSNSPKLQGQPTMIKSLLDSSSSSSKYTEFDKRISVLENALCSWTNNLDGEILLSTILTSNANTAEGSRPTRSLFDLLQKVESKLLLIDPASMDVYKSKVAALKIEIDFMKSKPAIDGKALEMYKKVEDVFITVLKIETFVDQLPRLIMRLKALADVHAQAYNTNELLKSFQESMRKLDSEVKANRIVLDQVHLGLTDSLSKLDANERVIEQKIASLQNKL